MIYLDLATDSSLLEVVTIRSLADLRYEKYGDAKAERFWSDWVSIAARMDEDLKDSHMRDMLYAELVKSPGLMIPLVKYEDTETKDRTYDMLAERIVFLYSPLAKTFIAPKRFYYLLARVKV